MTQELSRRTALRSLGRAGAALWSLNALGLLPVPTALAKPPELPPGSGRGITVAILGAGIAGLTSALLLRRAGYTCIILEARARAGGRVWTLRSGDKIEEIGSTQQVTWAAHPELYFNAGAGRICHHHRGILGYCREFNVPLEVFVNDNRAALIQMDSQFGGAPQVMKRVMADMRGAIAALAAGSGSPDNALKALLVNFGDLKKDDLSYPGSSRAGYAGLAAEPGAGNEPGTIRPPLPVGDIGAVNAASQILQIALTFPEQWNQQATMLQPVGGMDKIVSAMVKAIGGNILFRHEVQEIKRVGNRARIVAYDGVHRRHTTTDADYVVCTIPLPVLKDIKADFTPSVKAAIGAGATVYFNAAKVAFDSSRWWEAEDNIYGGISWTSRDINQIWYPSHGFHRDRGIIGGAYIWDPNALQRYAALSPPQRLDAAKADGEVMHPGYAIRVSRGVSVLWSKVPYSLGGWAEWDFFEGSRQTIYPVLLPPDGPFYFAGEHMSYVNGWQEGAVQSAHATVIQIASRAQASRP